MTSSFPVLILFVKLTNQQFNLGAEYSDLGSSPSSLERTRSGGQSRDGWNVGRIQLVPCPHERLLHRAGDVRDFVSS